MLLPVPWTAARSAGAALFSAIMGPRRRAKEDQAALDAAAAAAAAATRAAAGARIVGPELPVLRSSVLAHVGHQL